MMIINTNSKWNIQQSRTLFTIHRELLCFTIKITTCSKKVFLSHMCFYQNVFSLQNAKEYQPAENEKQNVMNYAQQHIL